MILYHDTELGSEVKSTPPDEVQSFHVQHLPHPHSGFSKSSMVTRSRCGDGVSVVHEMTVPRRVQPRSQGLSSLPPLSLRKDPGSLWSRVCQNLEGSPNVCWGMGGNVGLVDIAKKGISTQLILWPDDTSTKCLTAVFYELHTWNST